MSAGEIIEQEVSKVDWRLNLQIKQIHRKTLEDAGYCPYHGIKKHYGECPKCQEAKAGAINKALVALGFSPEPVEDGLARHWRENVQEQE